MGLSELFQGIQVFNISVYIVSFSLDFSSYIHEKKSWSRTSVIIIGMNFIHWGALHILRMPCRLNKQCRDIFGVNYCMDMHCWKT